MLIQFVQNSGVAAGLIAVILLLRRVRRLPSGCLDALWIAALVRLFIPFNLPSPFSIYRLLAHTPQPDTLSTSLTQSTVFAVNPLSPMSIFGVVWAIGTAFALTHLALSYLRLLHICRNAQPVCDPSILQAVQNAGLRRPVSVRTHPSITLPCTFGILRRSSCCRSIWRPKKMRLCPTCWRMNWHTSAVWTACASSYSRLSAVCIGSTRSYG